MEGLNKKEKGLMDTDNSVEIVRGGVGGGESGYTGDTW